MSLLDIWVWQSFVFVGYKSIAPISWGSLCQQFPGALCGLWRIFWGSLCAFCGIWQISWGALWISWDALCQQFLVGRCGLWRLSWGFFWISWGSLCQQFLVTLWWRFCFLRLFVSFWWYSVDILGLFLDFLGHFVPTISCGSLRSLADILGLFVGFS